MFTTQDMIAALILGLAVGGFMGAIVWDALVAQPLRQHRDVLRARVNEWRIRAYTASTRATARALALRGAPELADNADHSKNAERPTLRSVPS